MKNSTLLLVQASKPDKVTMPAHHCSCVLPAEELDAEERLQEAQDLVADSYVLPDSNFLPLPRQNYDYKESGCIFSESDMLACSYPSPQHASGTISNLVILIVLELLLSCLLLRTLPGQEGWCAMASCTLG